MASIAGTLEDRPLPEANAPEVFACLPPSPAAAVIGVDHAEKPIGAAWWHLHEPSMLVVADGSPIPEMTIAVAESARGQGTGARLIEALASQAPEQFSLLGLNVHLRKPASRLYCAPAFAWPGRGGDGLGSR